MLVTDAAERFGVAPTCRAFALSRATYYRRRAPQLGPRPRKAPPPRALSKVERDVVLGALHDDRFIDLAPAQVYATLLDENVYHCSERTMYRILQANREVRERRNQLRHPAYAAPELLATKPNELWSWDITKLHGPAKWTYYYLYVIMDVFSRYVVGWMIAHHESAVLATKLIAETCRRQAIKPDQLGIHADRGSSMKSKAVALLLSDLGVVKTHSRPHVSNDNPFSEALFKTVKYRPAVPDRFGAIEDARSCFGDLLAWYNGDHHHGALGLLTPHDVHHGLAQLRVEHRAAVLDAAHARHPERFPRGRPKPARPPIEVWINKPKSHAEATEEEPAAAQ